MVEELTCGDAWLTGRHTSFVNTTKKPISGLGKESKVAKRNGPYTAEVIWCEVIGLWICDGSCERGTCGAGIMIQVLTKTLGWATVHKSADRYRAGIPSMPNWVAVAC